MVMFLFYFCQTVTVLELHLFGSWENPGKKEERKIRFGSARAQ